MKNNATFLICILLFVGCASSTKKVDDSKLMAESNELRQEFYNSSTIYEGIQTLQTEAQLFEKSPVQSLEYKYFNLFMIYSELSYLYGKQEKLKEKKSSLS